MKRTRFALGLALIGAALVSPMDGKAKARNLYATKENLEAVVFHVDTSDNPGDTDMNVLLRPPSPDVAVAWFNQFWPYVAQEWVDDILVDATKTATYGESCKACAGTGPTGTTCKVDAGKTYSAHPCPRLFACGACLNDIQRTASRTYHDPMLGFKFDLADLTVKAEIFVNDLGSSWNDDNGTFREMKDDLGFPRTTCNEGDPGTVCGHTVWVSGHIATDGVHDQRPELHPVSAMIIDRGYTPNMVRKLRIGSFIDGSTDWSQELIPWTANYHDLLPMLARTWRFDLSTDPFIRLFRGKPPTASSSSCMDGCG